MSTDRLHRLSQPTSLARQEEILRVIKRERILPIRLLKREIDISPMSLWRDLKALEEAGCIKRMHGAVALPDYSVQGGGEPVFQEKAASRIPQKMDIARYVATQLVSPGDILGLTSGSTVSAVVPFLTQSSLTLLTNSLDVVNAASVLAPRFTLLVSGGLYRELSHTFVGPEAERFFQENAADTVLLGAAGLSADDGVTDPNPLDTAVKKAMLARARRVVLLMDSSKLGTRSMRQVLPLNEVDIVVTDGEVSGEMVGELERLGLEVRVAPAGKPLP